MSSIYVSVASLSLFLYSIVLFIYSRTSAVYHGCVIFFIYILIEMEARAREGGSWSYQTVF